VALKIDRRLNFVVPVYDDDGKTIRAYVHSTPLAREVADQYFLILGQTFSQLFNQGLGVAAGPGMALRLLTKIAKDRKVWDDNPDTGERGVRNLVDEIRRLTMVIVPAATAKGGWEPVPLQVAVDRKVVSDEDQAEVENAIVFFIAVSATLNRAPRKEMLSQVAGLWDAQLSSLNSTEFVASLTTSTATESSGEKSPAPASETATAANATVDGKPASVPH
jgi:hypothetical protein